MTKFEYVSAVWEYLAAEWPEKSVLFLQLITAQQIKKSAVDLWILNYRRKRYSVPAAAGRVANLISLKSEKGVTTK